MYASDLAQYLRERILKVRIAVLWVLLTAAVSLNNVARPHLLPWIAAACALFLMAFRLWDDVADLEHDRQFHSDRHLCRSQNVAFFRATHWFLVVASGGFIFLLTDVSRAAGFWLLVVVLWATYGITSSRPRLRPLRMAVVLTKYPALILLLAQNLEQSLPWIAAIGIYVLLILDEARSIGSGIVPPFALIAAVVVVFKWALNLWK